MFTKENINQIIDECREIGDEGLNNGVFASIPELGVDILEPPCDFLGVKGNPAIFINRDTYKLLGRQHDNWVENKTIALKAGFLQELPINIIGAIIHETGHAFNIAAQISNTEANAYIFEIEVMLKLLETESPLLFGCTKSDVQSYFATRLPYYNKEVGTNDYVADLVKYLNSHFDMTENAPVLSNAKTNIVHGERFTLFSQGQWKKELPIVTATINADTDRNPSEHWFN